jgi:hypothetical protein
MTSLLAAHATAASSGLQSSPITWILGVIIFVYMVVDVWRSNATTGAKIGWTIFSFFCTILALIVWLVWGRKRANQGAL